MPVEIGVTPLQLHFDQYCLSAYFAMCLILTMTFIVFIVNYYKTPYVFYCLLHHTLIVWCNGQHRHTYWCKFLECLARLTGSVHFIHCIHEWSLLCFAGALEVIRSFWLYDFVPTSG